MTVPSMGSSLFPQSNKHRMSYYPHHFLRVRPTFALLLVFLLGLCAGCGKREQKPSSLSSVFEKEVAATADGDYDLENIRQSGELIVATLSGPETYYEHRGMQLGVQYALACHFADTEGLGVRIETAADTTALLELLEAGEVDVVAYPLDEQTLADADCVQAGAKWAVRQNATELADALNAWYSPEVFDQVRQSDTDRLKQSRQVQRRAQAVYLSRDRGVISIYDNLFRDAAAVTGWDWKLIAAQCYQESAFDPNARSYVGAQGLMQLMPATAGELGLKPGEAFNPERNLWAASRYIVKLTQTFQDIRDPQERLKFVLASYNGGARHVRDAMALAKKYGHDPNRWDDVAPYILGLQQRKYYTDPVVKYGYMIGSETAGYVQSILERWRDYGGKVAVTHPPHLPGDSPSAATDSGSDANASNTPARRARPNRYASGTKVMRPDDPAFNQMDVAP